MLRYLIENRNPLIWVLFHALLGGLCILTPWPLIFWFYFILITSLLRFFKRSENHFLRLTELIAYIISFELIGRISGTSPFIPYEVGKYLLFVLLIFGILMGYRKGVIGWIMIILLIPGILFDESGLVGFKNVVFNLLGPINVGLAIIFFKNQSISKEDFRGLLKLLALPTISVLSFVIIKTPDFETVKFNLGPNFETSGGSGTNQVSTILGFGAFLTFLFWRNKWYLSGYRWVDFILFILFIFRGLLTFSRGGMLGGVLGIIVLLLYTEFNQDYSSKPWKIFKNLFKAMPLIVLFIIVFQYADRLTEGNLLLRYKGETPGTLAGYKVKTLNIFTSNRLSVFEDDIALWREYPIFGVGIGASSYLRENTQNISAHVELSRLLSEHGFLGLVYFVILFSTGYKVFREAPKVSFGPILLALFLIAFFTTFHSAMRTFISPLMIGLSLLTIHNQSENPYPN